MTTNAPRRPKDYKSDKIHVPSVPLPPPPKKRSNNVIIVKEIKQ